MLWPPMPHQRLTPAFLWQIMIKIPHLHSYSRVTGVQEGKLSLKKHFPFYGFYLKILRWFCHDLNPKSSNMSAIWNLPIKISFHNLYKKDLDLVFKVYSKSIPHFEFFICVTQIISRLYKTRSDFTNVIISLLKTNLF